ncbi:hypothetical protein BKA65DRAFT_593644 [Rhexocercosporidium sp. MPI-PUGE-AT-0058]|nr:hypothetical protein BKA65DRAFT_593644 [Rhexocercosporidium sp. MPI-PUGE-AT-0058]
MAANWPTSWPPPETELHTFDPNGDVLFILSRWPPSNDDDDASSDGEYDDDSEYSSSDEDEEVMNPEQLSDPGAKLLTEDSGTIGAHQVSQTDTTTESVLQTIHMRASSRHLMLASPTFLSMLSPGYKEGGILQAQGSVVIPLPDDDPDALIILLNIIHGKTRLVPREVDLQTLAELATLVDYYHMQETVELWSDLWIEKVDLEVGLHSQLHADGYEYEFSQADTLKRLFISWVFQKAAAFKKLSRDIEYMGTEELCWEDRSDYEVDLEDLEKLPIPLPILNAINAKRAAAIKKAVSIIRDLVQKYTQTTVRCPYGGFKCDATVLGSIIKNAATVWLWPPPEETYDGSFIDLTDAIRDIKIVTSCSQVEGQPKFEHGVDSFIEASLLSIEDDLCGLDIEDFIPKDRVRL